MDSAAAGPDRAGLIRPPQSGGGYDRPASPAPAPAWQRQLSGRRASPPQPLPLPERHWCARGRVYYALDHHHGRCCGDPVRHHHGDREEPDDRRVRHRRDPCTPVSHRGYTRRSTAPPAPAHATAGDHLHFTCTPSILRAASGVTTELLPFVLQHPGDLALGPATSAASAVVTTPREGSPGGATIAPSPMAARIVTTPSSASC